MARRFAALALLFCCAFGGVAVGAAIPNEIAKVVTLVFFAVLLLPGWITQQPFTAAAVFPTGTFSKKSRLLITS